MVAVMGHAPDQLFLKIFWNEAERTFSKKYLVVNRIPFLEGLEKSLTVYLEEKLNLLRRGFKLILKLNLACDWSSEQQFENLEKWIQNIFEIMNSHLERKRIINCFIESGKVYINQNAGKFMISEEFDQEGFLRSI